MIYVKRDPALLPANLLKVAERAQNRLEQLPEVDRKAFIERKSHVWRAFGRYLAKMSHAKCWYSESNDPQSFFDVDHFRPKKAAKRGDTQEDDGYPWLAFTWGNFRYSAGRSNRLSTDEATAIVMGKGSWFPLLDGSITADWDNRCEDDELRVLLDPTVLEDVALIDVNAEDGRASCSFLCVGTVKKERVTRSIQIYGLNLGNLITARKRIMRDVKDNYQNLMDVAAEGNDMPAIERLHAQLRRATSSDAPYARAARAMLHSLPYGSNFCATPEDVAAP